VFKRIHGRPTAIKQRILPQCQAVYDVGLNGGIEQESLVSVARLTCLTVLAGARRVQRAGCSAKTPPCPAMDTSLRWAADAEHLRDTSISAAVNSSFLALFD